MARRKPINYGTQDNPNEFKTNVKKGNASSSTTKPTRTTSATSTTTLVPGLNPSDYGIVIKKGKEKKANPDSWENIPTN